MTDEETELRYSPWIRVRLILTVIISVAWLVGVLIFFAFYGHVFNIWQNIAVCFSSLLIIGGLFAIMWIKVN